MPTSGNTYNVIGQSPAKKIGGGETVWLRVNHIVQGGRPVNPEDLKNGKVYPAGTMVVYDKDDVTKPVTFVAADAEEAVLATVNGHLLNDVYAGDLENVQATCAIVIGGVLRKNLVPGGIPDAVQKNLPMIEYTPN